MKKLFKSHFGLFFVLLISLLPLSWFKDGAIISTYDTNIYLNPLIYFEKLSTFWGVDNLGSYNLGVQFIFPVAFLWKILGGLKISPNVIQKIYFVIFYWLIPGLSIYWLVKKIVSWKTVVSANIAGVLAAALYLVNPYTMLTEFAIDVNIHLVYSFIPLTFLIVFQGLKNPKHSTFYAVIYALSLSLFAGITSHVPAFVMTLLPAFACIIFFFFSSDTPKKLIIIFVFKMVFFSLMVNLWWWLGFVNELFAYKQIIEPIAKSGPLYNMAKIPELVRLLGHWMFKYQLYDETAYVLYAQEYYSLPLAFLNYLIPVICFSCLLLVKREERKMRGVVILFSLLAIIAIFLGKGGNEPFGSVFVFLFKKLPLFWIFRDPFAKFVLVLAFSYAVLYAIASVLLIERLKKLFKTKKTIFDLILFSFFLTLVLVVSYPHLTDQVIRNYDYKKVRKGHVVIPEYWLEAKDYLEKNDSEGRLFVLTKTAYASPMLWPSGFNGNPAPVLFPNGVIYFHHELPVTRLVYDQLDPGKDNQFIMPMMRLFNARYFLLPKDVDFQYDDYGGKNEFLPQDYQLIIKNLVNP